MHRLPLADQLPYRFHPPQVNPLIVRATRRSRGRMLRREHQLAGIDVDGIDHLARLLNRGDGIMLAANHCGRADGLVMFDLADRLGCTICAMAAYQIFEGNAGIRHWLFPRMGIFPVDREGADLSAFKAAVEVLSEGKHPLLIFPEGEVYYLADRLTPLREGAATIALSAAKRHAEAGRTVWVVPIALKYRFPEDHDPTPSFLDTMARLERRLTWRPRPDLPLVERIYRYAEALLTLKEFEYLGECGTGPLKQRIVSLRDHLLDAMEGRRLGKRHPDEPVPVRVKDLRKACLDALKKPETTPDQADSLRRDLEDIFLIVQSYSYPGDYVSECPTPERISETLMKLDEDLLLDGHCAPPLGPRRAVVRIGEPIDAGSLLASAAKPRHVAPALTAEMEQRMQRLLDQIGPGRLAERPPVLEPSA